MKIPVRNVPGRRMAGIAICVVVLLLSAKLPYSHGEAAKPTLSSEERFRLGEQMYREGILPSGEPMQAFAKGDLPVPGTAFTCVSCHLRSGLGSIEGGVITPPTNGAKLYQPFKGYSTPTFWERPFVPRPIVKENLKYFPKPPSRPVYTDATLAEVIRYGDDPTGRILNDVMPRYLLQDDEMELLVSYLKSLSVEFSSGVSDTVIRFATIITDDVSFAERNAMLIPLENYVRSRNETFFLDEEAGVMGARSRLMSEMMFSPKGVAVRRLSLSRWELKGPPETWRNQLEEYYRKEPVFAFLGGITGGEWQPVHQFCEEHHIPNIFPITDFPFISQSDWYTLYLSKGYYQEGEGAARFLNDKGELKGKRIVQVVRDTPEGRALSRGFLETWRDFGQEAPVTVVLKPGAAFTPDLLQREAAGEKPAVIVLWDGPESLKALETLAAGPYRPAMVLLPSSLLGRSMFSLDERIRDFTYITYPYGISQTPEEKLLKAQTGASMGVKDFNAEANAVSTVRTGQQAYIITTILNMALLEMRGNYYRDHLLDVIGMFMDQDVPLYERLSFGPGQRYASKGCYVVQLGKGPRPALVKKSNWVIH